MLSPSTNEFAYTARERHDRTGLYYYRNRFYYPQIGRFISQDPIGVLGGTNLYAYVGNNPVNYIDPLGLERYVIIVGDPGLGQFDVGSNFTRAAETRAEQLRGGGHTADILYASSAAQFALAISNGNPIDGGVVYYGHGSNSALYIGETSAPGTNLTRSNISILSNANLGESATVGLNSCNAARAVGIPLHRRLQHNWAETRLVMIAM